MISGFRVAGYNYPPPPAAEIQKSWRNYDYTNNRFPYDFWISRSGVYLNSASGGNPEILEKLHYTNNRFP